MPNLAFTAHTRSATFALTLSDPMIGRLLRHREVDRLRAKDPWYEPHAINFGKVPDGTADPNLQLQAAWDWLGCDSTDRALIRRGLLELNIGDRKPGSNMVDAPASRYDLIRTTMAGALVAELLVEADFHLDPASVPGVPPHPESRPIIDVGQGGAKLREPLLPEQRDEADMAFWTLPRGRHEFDRYARR